MPVEIQCSCGQIIHSNDPPGTELRCANCDRIVMVPASPSSEILHPRSIPGNQQELAYAARSPGDILLTPRAFEMLRQTILWVRIMSVLIILTAGLMLLGGAALFLLGLTSGPRNEPPAVLGCVYIPLSALYVLPAIFLWRYASHTKAFIALRHEQQLEEALQAQKSFWKFVAITALVIIGIYLLMIPIAAIGFALHR